MTTKMLLLGWLRMMFVHRAGFRLGLLGSSLMSSFWIFRENLDIFQQFSLGCSLVSLHTKPALTIQLIFLIKIPAENLYNLSLSLLYSMFREILQKISKHFSYNLNFFRYEWHNRTCELGNGNLMRNSYEKFLWAHN
jgi:hypothetical protein